MAAEPGPIAILGNVTLDVICKTVDDVPRQDSIDFQQGAVTPGGCASNTALQLARLGEPVLLIAHTGDDWTASFLEDAWRHAGVDISLVRRTAGFQTGISIGLVDSQLQPRFIYTPGANTALVPDSLDPALLIERGVSFLHVAGYFVLPGLLDRDFARQLVRLREAGIQTSLDVVFSPAMKEPEVLYALLPHLDLFTCNRYEGELISGFAEPRAAAAFLHERGARAVVIKLGPAGCWLSEGGKGREIPAPRVDRPLDTTGAGDAFAAGLLSGLREGLNLPGACRLGNQTGAAAVSYLGAVRLD